MDKNIENKCNHQICVWHDFENSSILTLQELQDKATDGCDIGDWTIEDYINVHKDTNITRFSYCPQCGEKIDWNNLI